MAMPRGMKSDSVFCDELIALTHTDYKELEDFNSGKYKRPIPKEGVIFGTWNETDGFVKMGDYDDKLKSIPECTAVVDVYRAEIEAKVTAMSGKMIADIFPPEEIEFKAKIADEIYKLFRNLAGNMKEEELAFQELARALAKGEGENDATKCTVQERWPMGNQKLNNRPHGLKRRKSYHNRRSGGERWP